MPRSSPNLRRTGRPVDLTAALAAIGFASLAIFQAALAAGAPWGDAAWGGGNAHLSAGQRAASAVAAAVYVAATLIVCRGASSGQREAATPGRVGNLVLRRRDGDRRGSQLRLAERLGELHLRPTCARPGSAVHCGRPRNDH